MSVPMKLVVLGLSLSSSWGNGHATTFRALLAAMAARGHEILFLERDQPWYAANRDLPAPGFCRLAFYRAAAGLERWRGEIADADAVIVGSFVPDGAEVAARVLRMARGVTAFYDIDTPVTLARLAAGRHDYITPALIPRFDLYLSFTGGPTLRLLEERYRARAARPLYCSVDPAAHAPQAVPLRWHLGYLGTYSQDRQPALERLLLQPARMLPDHRFVVAGPQYPDTIAWPENVDRIDHVPPAEHAVFYASQAWALNLTRADMIAAGYSPSVRIFEAAACGTPLISDPWDGLDTVLRDGTEIVVAASPQDVVRCLAMPDDQRRAIAGAARARVLAEHTAEHRAAELEAYLLRAAERLPDREQARA